MVGKTISLRHGERMKFFKVALKTTYQPKKEGYPDALMIGIKRYISKITPDEKKELEKIYPPEKLADIEESNNKMLAFLSGAKFQIKKKLGEKFAKLFNIQIAENSAEIFEYIKIRKYSELYNFIYDISKSIGFMYQLQENSKDEIDINEIERNLKRLLHKGLWSGKYMAEDYERGE